MRPLGCKSDTALAFLQALDDLQRKQASLSFQFRILSFGPAQEVTHEGLTLTQVNDRPRALAMDIVAEWVGITNAGQAAERIAQIKAELNRLGLHGADQ